LNTASAKHRVDSPNTKGQNQIRDKKQGFPLLCQWKKIHGYGSLLRVLLRNHNFRIA
jgi:hypothetical protein